MIEKLKDSPDIYCIAGEGSLLLFLPTSLCSEWGGSDPSLGRQIEAKFRWGNPSAPATDYDRACDVTNIVEPITVGEGTGIVIAEDYLVHWMPLPKGGMFLRITDGWQNLAYVLPQITEDMWSETLFEYDVTETDFVLFDPAYPGDKIQEKLDIHLPLGRYKVSTAETAIEGIPFLAHRLIVRQNR